MTGIAVGVGIGKFMKRGEIARGERDGNVNLEKVRKQVEQRKEAEGKVDVDKRRCITWAVEARSKRGKGK